MLGEGALAFQVTYGAMTFAEYVATIYNKIVGNAFATQAGINPTTAIADIVSRQTALTQIARDAGMITATSTAAQIDIALKAATAGYIIGESVKADVGLYAAASNNFTFAVISGNPTYNVDLIATYASLGGGLGSPVAPYFFVPVAPPGQTYRLTTATDTFTGLAGPDVFNANDLAADNVTHTAVFTTGDVLDGGAGADTLSIISGTGVDYTVATATVSNIETVTITGDRAVTVAAGAWTGVTSFSVFSVGSATVTAPASSAVGVIASTLGTGGITVNGGSSVAITATGATGGGGGISVGATTAPTGAITASITTSGNGAAGAIDVKGGTTVNITQTAASGTQTNGAITVTGTTATTSVTATSTPAGGGVTANSVTIIDVNSPSAAATTVGTITSVAVSGYTTLRVDDNNLSTLSLTKGSGNVTIFDNSARTTKVTTLGLTLNGLTGGALIDEGIYTTLNVTTNGAASIVTGVTMGSVTTLNIGGSQTVALGSAAGLTGLVTVATSGTAGITGAAGAALDLSGLGGVTSVNASASTGSTTAVKINNAVADYVGGAGTDKVTLSNSTITKSIALGGGDDTLTLADGTTSVVGFTLTGGGQVADTLVMRALDADVADNSAAFRAAVSGFGRLNLTSPGATTVAIDPTALGFSWVIASGFTALTLNNMTSGGTLVLNGNGTAYDVSTGGSFGGGSDTFNIVLSSTNGTLVDGGTVTANNIETINLGSFDLTGASTILNKVTLTAGAVTSITTGASTAGLELVYTGTTATTVSASNIAGGGFKWTAGALAGPSTVAGSTSGTNTVNLSAAVGAVNYTGGTGADIITSGKGADTINLGAGAGADKFVFLTHSTNGSDTISGFSQAAGDTLNIAALGDGSTPVAGAITITSAGAQQAATDDLLYVITTNGAANNLTTGVGGATVSDWTNTGQVATYLSERFTAAANNENVFVINVSSTTYVYSYVDAGATGGIAAGEINLVGTVNNGGTALTTAALVIV